MNGIHLDRRKRRYFALNVFAFHEAFQSFLNHEKKKRGKNEERRQRLFDYKILITPTTTRKYVIIDTIIVETLPVTNDDFSDFIWIHRTIVSTTIP